MNSSMTKFLWKGKQYDDISTLGNELLEALWKDNTTKVAFVEELLQKGVLSQYVLCMDENETQKANAIKAIESSYRTFKNDNHQKTMNYYLLLLTILETLKKSFIKRKNYKSKCKNVRQNINYIFGMGFGEMVSFFSERWWKRYFNR